MGARDGCRMLKARRQRGPPDRRSSARRTGPTREYDRLRTPLPAG